MASAAKVKRDQQRAEVRRILLFLRAANRLREVTSRNALRVKTLITPGVVESPDSRHRVLSDMKLIEGVDALVLDNVATRLRPFMHQREACYVPEILEVLPKHVKVQNGPMTFDELAARWNQILNGTTAPIPVGMKFHDLIPGYVAEATKEGTMTLMFDGALLTGKEVVELIIYGELIHIDRSKERKLMRLRQSELSPGFHMAVVSVVAGLAVVIDIMRLYAEGFINLMPPDLLDEIEEEIAS